MAVTVVEEAGNTTTTDGNEQSLFQEEDAGVFFVRLDLNDMVADATPDILEIREYISVRAASTKRQLGPTVVLVAGLTPQIIELPHRSIPVNCTYEVTIWRVGGSDFDVVWSEIEVG